MIGRADSHPPVYSHSAGQAQLSACSRSKRAAAHIGDNRAMGDHKHLPRWMQWISKHGRKHNIWVELLTLRLAGLFLNMEMT